MKHLGERVTALVDDQLDHDARDLALAHLAQCPACQAAVEAERQVSAAMRGLPEVPPSPELVTRLLALSEPGGPLPPVRRPFPGAAPPVAGWRAERRHPVHSSRLRHRTGARLAVAGSVSVGVVAVALAALGGADAEPPVVPPMEQFTVEHARSTGSLLFSDPAASLVPTQDVAP